MTFAGTFSILTAPAAVDLDFSTSNGLLTGTGNWVYGGSSWYVNGHTSQAFDYLTTPGYTAEANGQITGSFTHRFTFEYYSDGGQLQYRVNSGTWNTVPGNLITGVTYNSPVYGFVVPYGSGTQYGFNNTSTGYATPAYVTSSFTLGSGPSPYQTGSAATFTAGDQVELRFLAAWDVSVSNPNPNWEIRSLSVSAVSGVPEPQSYAMIAGCGLAGLAAFRRIRGR